MDVTETVHEIEAQVRRLGEAERRLFSKLLRREPVARDTWSLFEEQRTLGARVADRVAAFGGSWTFIWLFVATMIAWIVVNVEAKGPFDPYPFILLNLILSCLAALQAPVILMSQNRMAAKDRLEAHHDFEVDRKAELEIMALHEKIDDIRETRWTDLVRLQDEQITLLKRLVEARTIDGKP